MYFLHKTFCLNTFDNFQAERFFLKVNLKISPHKFLWYKNIAENGMDIFIRKLLSRKRRPFNIFKNLPFVTIFLLFF